MAGHIALIQAGARPLAVVRVTTVISRWPREFVRSLDKVYQQVKAGRVRKGGHNVMVYRHRNDGQVDIECGIEVDGPFEPAGEVVYSQTPSGAAVTGAHLGPYDQLGRTHDAIVAWAGQNGHALQPICWEIYGDPDPDPAKCRTDIFHLVRG